ncbi:hypothetical protein [Shimia ponticola]|uniref:hypothetical protein n=1 Tax=Shimia ponticola TaxID=2582893 RepID=UPI0011BEB790|nr:hypothetical protein [Shimia ponticola]
MKNPTVRNRRFEFQRGELLTISDLGQTGSDFTQKKPNARSFWRSHIAKWRSLVDDPVDDPKCLFCSFSLDKINQQYGSLNGNREFVTSLDEHCNFWRNGLWVVAKPNGWHLINELIGPINHLTRIEDFDSFGDVFEIAAGRWRAHQIGLDSSASINKRSIYHGLVVNRKAGQSIEHLHFHCYTSQHPERFLDLFCDQNQLKNFDFGFPGSAFVSSDDFPHLGFSIPIDDLFLSESESIEIVASLTNLLFACYSQLFSSVPPGSFGFFFRPKASQHKLVLIYCPLQWHGTIQSFQGSKFFQFDHASIKDEFGAALLHRL